MTREELIFWAAFLSIQRNISPSEALGELMKRVIELREKSNATAEWTLFEKEVLTKKP